MSTTSSAISLPSLTLSQRLARAVLRFFGWEIVGQFPNLPKFILVGAPHTSNWDFMLAMLLMFGTGLRFNWVAKASAFRGPWGVYFRKLGGIPVQRDRKTNFTSQMIENFNQSERMVIAITPEGTRSRVDRWRTGFYHMAIGANVPMVLVYVDYPRRKIGIGPVLHASPDINETFAQLRAFYSDKVGKFPHKQGRIEPG